MITIEDVQRIKGLLEQNGIEYEAEACKFSPSASTRDFLSGAMKENSHLDDDSTIFVGYDKPMGAPPQSLTFELSEWSTSLRLMGAKYWSLLRLHSDREIKLSYFDAPPREGNRLYRTLSPIAQSSDYKLTKFRDSFTPH